MYALDRLGTPATIDRNGFPVGGNAVIVLNGELRVPVWKDVGVVGFVDAGNVWSRVGDFAFGEIGRAGDGVERVAVARDDEVRARVERRRQ